MYFVTSIHPPIHPHIVTLLRIEKGREGKGREKSEPVHKPQVAQILASAKIPDMDRSTRVGALAAPCKRAPRRPKVYDMGRLPVP